MIKHCECGRPIPRHVIVGFQKTKRFIKLPEKKKKVGCVNYRTVLGFPLVLLESRRTFILLRKCGFQFTFLFISQWTMESEGKSSHFSETWSQICYLPDSPFQEATRRRFVPGKENKPKPRMVCGNEAMAPKMATS
jgi:hypothetical protein